MGPAVDACFSANFGLCTWYTAEPSIGTHLPFLEPIIFLEKIKMMLVFFNYFEGRLFFW
jgi:hypothetical protein